MSIFDLKAEPLPLDEDDPDGAIWLHIMSRQVRFANADKEFAIYGMKIHPADKEMFERFWRTVGSFNTDHAQVLAEHRPAPGLAERIWRTPLGLWVLTTSQHDSYVTEDGVRRRLILWEATDALARFENLVEADMYAPA